MLQEERYRIILAELERRGAVKVAELAEQLDLSESTVRRDINELAAEGKLRKVFGGAVAFERERKIKTVEEYMADKAFYCVREKESIARYAASLIDDNDFVYIDAGTTTEYMIEYITAKDATFVTNALSHAVGLARKGFKVYIIGGLIKSVTEAIIDSEAIISLSKYNFTKGFFGTNGLSSDRGFTTPDVREADIKNFAMRRCAKKFVLCDSSKFNKISKATFAAGSDITVITDKITENIKGYNIKEAAQL